MKTLPFAFLSRCSALTYAPMAPMTGATGATVAAATTATSVLIVLSERRDDEGTRDSRDESGNSISFATDRLFNLFAVVASLPFLPRFHQHLSLPPSAQFALLVSTFADRGDGWLTGDRRRRPASLGVSLRIHSMHASSQAEAVTQIPFLLSHSLPFLPMPSSHMIAGKAAASAAFVPQCSNATQTAMAHVVLAKQF